MSHQKKIGNYYLLKPIGVGSFAKVYKGLDEKTNDIVAIKMINKLQFPSEKNDLIDKEIMILKSLNHPNIIRIIDIKKTQNNIYLIFEYCQMGDLESYIKKCYYNPATKKARVPENVAQKIIIQLSEAFKLMSEKNIVHRDLKLANILVSKDFIIKLADFGFAKFVENNLLLQSYCGTPITMAPEILKRKQYNQKCDIWSLGIIIYRMLFGEYPFFPASGGSLEDLIDVINNKDIIFPESVVVSEEVKKLMRNMLVIDPSKRMGFDEFFENSWVKGGKNINNVVLNDSELQEALKSVFVDKNSQGLEKKSDIFEEFNIQKMQNVQNLANVQNIKNVQNVQNMQNVQNVQNVQNIQNMENMENIENIQNVQNMQKNTVKTKIEENLEILKINENEKTENSENISEIKHEKNSKESRLVFMHLKLRNLLRSKIYDLFKDINDSNQISEYFLRHKQHKCAFLILMFMLNKLKAMLSHKIELKLSESMIIYQFHEIYGSITKELKNLFKEYYNKTEKLFKDIDWTGTETLNWNQLIFHDFLELCKTIYVFYQYFKNFYQFYSFY